jgi:hypothetical protein
MERYPFSFRGLTKEKRKVKIFGRDSAKFRGSSDLAAVQGGHGEKIPKGLNLRRDRAIDSKSQEPLDLHVVSCIRDSGVEAPKVV